MTSREQFESWFIGQYENNLYDDGLKFPPSFKKFLGKLRPKYASGAQRMNAFVATKYNYPLTKAGYVCSVFTCDFKDVSHHEKILYSQTQSNSLQQRLRQDVKTDKKKEGGQESNGVENKNVRNEYETYYSYVYWPLDLKYVESRFGGDANQGDFSTFSIKEKIMPEYLCISPTFSSRDGEYRGDGFITWNEFQHAYEEHSELLSRVEEVIIALVEEKIITLDVTVYPVQRKNEILTQIDEERLIIRIMAASLLIDGHNYAQNIMQVHTNSNYLKLVSMIYKNTILDEIVKSIDYFKYAGLLSFKVGKPNRSRRPRCGQKLIPMTLKEAIEFKNPRHKIWKEVDAQLASTDLVINFICPSFSIYNNWTFIDNDKDQGFYEGKYMREKYMESIRSTLTIDTLKNARKDIPKKIHKEGEEEMPINYTYGQLSIKIYNAIEYGESLLIASKLSLCSLSEYVGYAFGSVPKLIRGLDFIELNIENMFSNIDLFARHMFDWMYACHCIHTKLGIIHGDLHLNNVTLFRSASVYKVDVDVDDKKIKVKPKFTNPTIAYILGDYGEHNCYLFECTGNYVCLIDFSRCMYGIQSLKRFEKERGQVFANGIFESQLDRMIKIIKLYAPKDFMDKHESKMKQYARNNPDNFFKLVSPIDFIMFSRYLREGLKEEVKHLGEKLGEFEVRHCQVSPEAVALVDNIYITALALFMKNLTIAFAEPVTEVKTPSPGIKSKEPKKSVVKFIGADLIKSVFGRWLYTNYTEEQRQKMDLLDVWNFNNPLKYSCRDYETWPDWAKAEKIRENLHGLKLTDILDRGPDIVQRSFQPDPFLEAVVERERLDSENIPDMMRSSVLPE